MQIAQVTFSHGPGNARQGVALLPQEMLCKFAQEVERRRRDAFLGYFAGVGVLAWLALIALGRICA